MDKCGECASWNLRDSPMRKVHFGLCRHEPALFAKSRCFSANAPCIRDKMFSPASAEVLEARGKVLKE